MRIESYFTHCQIITNNCVYYNIKILHNFIRFTLYYREVFKELLN
nr:MAG TPA: hypothetical protein [Bacteriophage sp.]